MEIVSDYNVNLNLICSVISNKIREFLVCPSEVVVRLTKNGRVKGIERETVYKHYYYSFEGIPFAEPPIGKLRFQAPQPVKSWTGIRDCTYVRSKPKQKNIKFGFIEGSEDCLYLNIYVKTLTSENPLPVIVWIHGGGFQIGEASRHVFSPDYFMEREVVLVCINYRIGAFGFISFDDPSLNIPGNAGIKDQIMALQWIKENIKSFNGDPDNITVLGQSAGAVATHLIMCCERARGLFHKAILMSSSALSTWSIFPKEVWPYRLACNMGYRGFNNDRDVYDFLLLVDSGKIANKHTFFLNEHERRLRYNAPFGTIIEPYESAHAVITKPVEEVVEKAWGNDIPIILGGTTFEGLLLYGNVMKYKYLINDLEDCESMVPREVQRACSKNEIKEMGLELKRVYFNGEEPNIEKNLMNYMDLVGHYTLLHGVHRYLLTRLTFVPSVPTYYYRFDYDSENYNFYRHMWVGRMIRGVIHSSDLQYLFNNVYSEKIPESSVEYEMIQRLVGMWTAFAYNSNPNCVELKSVYWRPANEFHKDTMECLKIGEITEMIKVPDSAKLALWDSFYSKVSKS